MFVGFDARKSMNWQFFYPTGLFMHLLDIYPVILANAFYKVSAHDVWHIVQGSFPLKVRINHCVSIIASVFNNFDYKSKIIVQVNSHSIGESYKAIFFLQRFCCVRIT